MKAVKNETTLATRTIGSLDVSLVGLGCNNFGWKLEYAATAAVVHAALDAGITFFDTADIYGSTRSEEFLGRALGSRRHEIVLATKFGMAVDARRCGARPNYVRQALEDSLRRLQTDYIDLYQLHQPDPDVPIAETLGALNDLVRAGKVREIGCSNFSAEQIQEATAVPSGAARFVSVQNEYNLLQREAEQEVLPECERQRLAFLPYFQLASGLLTGKYRRGQPMPEGSRLATVERFTMTATDLKLSVVESLLKFATLRGHTLIELAVSWLASNHLVSSVITGATSPEQVRLNASAAHWELTDQDLAEVDTLLS